MKTIQTMVGIAGLLFWLTASAENMQTPKVLNKLEPLPQDLEIQLALSALPPHLRDNATVYILNPAKGFEVARKGTNGFHAFVARTGDDAFRGSWPLTEYREDILYPISFDPAGAKEQMRVFFDAAEMQAQGNSSRRTEENDQRPLPNRILQIAGTSRYLIHAVSSAENVLQPGRERRQGPHRNLPTRHVLRPWCFQ